jgi:hypothetical protein
MRATSKNLVLGSAFVLAGLLAFAQEASAQDQQAYYYPTAGTYATTAGPVKIPSPGYYYNVPAAFAPAAPVGPPAGVWPGWSGVTSSPRSQVYSPTRVRRGYGSTPYYWGGGSGGTPHYLHGRGYDSGSHR